MKNLKTTRYAILPDNIWNGRWSRSKSGYAVIVEGSTIQAVCAAEAVPRGLKKHRFPGCTILPGLIDGHVHFCDWMRPGFLAAGVTTIRDVGNDLDWILERRRRARTNPSQWPNILCCGPLLDGPNAHWPFMGKAHADRAAIEASVKSQIEQDVDAIKLYVNITHEQMTGAAEVSRRYGKYILAHLGNFSAQEAAAVGINEIEHLCGCAAAWKESPIEGLNALCDDLLPSGMVMCPTLVVWDRIARTNEPAFRQDKRLKWVHPAFLQAWENFPNRFGAAEARLKLQRNVVEMKRCLAQMQERGIPIIAGTDSPFPYLVPGFSVHDELTQMVDAGLTPVNALRTATSRAAEVMLISKQVGTIAPGLQADFLITDGDPTKEIHDVARVRQVVRHGTLLKTEQLRRMSARLNRQTAEDPVSRDILGYVSAR
ncbi:MAG: amidohydrolase family protein [Planctomycetota bacterium]|nr:amidohydrolase family protein [Planctomycetota bacterium]